jgi:hypothetical protein
MRGERNFKKKGNPIVLRNKFKHKKKKSVGGGQSRISVNQFIASQDECPCISEEGEAGRHASQS